MPHLPRIILHKPTILSKSQQAIVLLRQLYRETSCLFDEIARDQIKLKIRRRFRSCKSVEDEQRRTKLLKDGRRALSTLTRANNGDKWRMVYVLQHAYGQVGRRKHKLLNPLLQGGGTPLEPLIPALPRTAPPSTSGRLHALLQAQIGKNIKLMEPVIPETNVSGKQFPIIRVANMKWRHRSNVLRKISPPMQPDEFKRMELIVMGFQQQEALKRKFITRNTRVGPKKQRPNVYSSRAQRRILRFILQQFPNLELIETPKGPRWVANYSAVLTGSLHTEGEAEDFEGVDEKGNILEGRSQTNFELSGNAAVARKKVMKKSKAFFDWLEANDPKNKSYSNISPVVNNLREEVPASQELPGDKKLDEDIPRSELSGKKSGDTL